MKNLKESVKTEDLIYVCLESNRAKEHFLIDAVRDGFIFHKGVIPKVDEMDDIYAVCSDMTVRYLGWAGHIRYHYARQGKLPNGQKFCQINYDE